MFGAEQLAKHTDFSCSSHVQLHPDQSSFTREIRHTEQNTTTHRQGRRSAKNSDRRIKQDNSRHNTRKIRVSRGTQPWHAEASIMLLCIFSRSSVDRQAWALQDAGAQRQGTALPCGYQGSCGSVSKTHDIRSLVNLYADFSHGQRKLRGLQEGARRGAARVSRFPVLNRR